MSVQAELLAAIRDNPDDDAVRLVYADYLEENGEPERAEFIRVQVNYDSPSSYGFCSNVLRDRSRELLAEHGRAWAADITGRGVYGIQFCRGFVERVSATAHAFICHGARWVEKAPIRLAQLRGVAGRGHQLAACLHLQGISDLRICDSRFGDKDLAPLAACPHLGRLRSLTVCGRMDDLSYVGATSGARVSHRGLRRLAEASFFPSVLILSITSDGTLGSPAVDALGASGATLGIRRLTLCNGVIDDRGAVSIANGHSYQNLARLWLPGNRITASGLTALAGAVSLPGLRWLNLSGNLIEAVDVEALAACFERKPKLYLELAKCFLPVRVQRELSRRFGSRVWVDHPARPQTVTAIS
jgi:uncharacterized protein (TIGR02996 family)